MIELRMSVLYGERNGIGNGHAIKGEMAALGDWFGVNGLTLNVDKTHIINFRADCRDSSQYIILSNSQLVSEEIVIFLGIHINKTLDWFLHIDKLGKHCVHPFSLVE